MKDILKIKNLKKNYKGREILKSISMDLESGEVVSLLGPNGAGKTTCFYCITGLIKQNRGTIAINEKSISHLPFYQRARLGIGYLPQESSIFRGMSVENNIMSVLEITEQDFEKRKQRLEELLNEFSISYLRGEQSTALSGGERRRLEIARCLATKPKFILLDEPFAGVDPLAIKDIKNIISHLKEKGYGVLITDHNVRETLGISDRAYVIYDGKILYDGTPDQIISHDDVRRIYLGDDFKL